jgi:hypothetical protein
MYVSTRMYIAMYVFISLLCLHLETAPKIADCIQTYCCNFYFSTNRQLKCVVYSTQKYTQFVGPSLAVFLDSFFSIVTSVFTNPCQQKQTYSYKASLSAAYNSNQGLFSLYSTNIYVYVFVE